MTIKTRIDCRSDKNDRIDIRDESGYAIAVVKTTSPRCELEVETAEPFYVTKPSGYTSKREG